MQSVDELHLEAMDIAEDALFLIRRGDQSRAKARFLDSLALERRAAELLPATSEYEPTRSVLYRSAASLAFRGEDYRSAERLIALGLAGFPPTEIEDELWALHEDIRFADHLRQRQMTLDPGLCVLSVGGPGIGSTKAPSEQVLTRVERLRNVIYRTAERMWKIPYRLTGGVSKEIRSRYEIFLHAFVPGSFSVTFQLGGPDQQLAFEFHDAQGEQSVNSATIFEEVMQCLSLFEDDRLEELRTRLSEEFFYDNFVGLAKEIAPNGVDVSSVGLSSQGPNATNDQVVLKRNRKQFSGLSATPVPTDEGAMNLLNPTIYRGILVYAKSPLSSDSKTGIVKLIENDTKQTIAIHVPMAWMKDVVQPYYEEQVVVAVRKVRQKFYLEDLSRDFDSASGAGEL